MSYARVISVFQGTLGRNRLVKLTFKFGIGTGGVQLQFGKVNLVY